MEIKRSEECQERGRCLLCVGEGERITSIVEMPRNREVERGTPERQMAACQRANTQEDSHCQKNATEQRNLGTLAYKIKVNGKTRLRKQNGGWGRERMTLYVGTKGFEHG